MVELQCRKPAKAKIIEGIRQVGTVDIVSRLLALVSKHRVQI
jgi:hypothetical protein